MPTINCTVVHLKICEEGDLMLSGVLLLLLLLFLLA